MNTVVKGLTALAVSLALCVPALAQEEEVTELNWGLLAVESQDNLMRRWGPLLEAMEEKIGIPINPFFATDYTGMIEAMRFDNVDLVLAGNASGMTAVDRAGAEVFAQEIEDDGTASGAPGYYSILVTQADNDEIDSLQDVLATCAEQSLDFGIGDPQSTSGFLVPTTFIFAANDVSPQECFNSVRNASHEANLLSVANGLVDVATANTVALYDRLEANNPEAFGQVKEIWRSPLIAGDPFLWRANLPEEVKAKIYHAVISFGRLGDAEQVARERALLEQGGFHSFAPSSNRQLLPFREMAANREILRIEGDETMSEEEKAEAIAKQRALIEAVRAEAAATPKL